ncbi:MAG TPA: SH3 domain-containing protein [Clostridia bacterium]|nr:SH3 domain-containing protein [Clostridia bacterium]
MKRVCALALALMLLMALLPAPAAAAAADISVVRVRLTTNNATSIVMSVTGEYFINENGRSFSGGSLTLRAANGVITVTHSTQGELFSGKSFTIKRAKMDPGAGSMYFNSRRYLGHFNVKLLSTGYIQVVNEVPLAHYLYGVVAYEMNDAYPIEALKAQAIAAKSYVLTAVLASPGAEYHIGDTSSDQVYKGFNSAYKNVIGAVDSTIDKVLTVGGNVLCAYYSASNGGETNLVTYAWPTKNASNAGYAISIDDYDIANSASLCETVTLPINSAGTISQAMYNLLLAKAYAGIGVQPTGISAIKSVDVHTPKLAGTTRNMSLVTIVMDVTTAGATYADVSVTFNAAELNTYGVVTNANLRCYWGEYSSDGGCYYIYHARWGHGVGLSQRGAQQRASLGASYADILAFYYPGATLASVTVPVVADPVKPSTVQGMTPIGTGKTTAEVNLRTGAGTGYTTLTTLKSGVALTVYESKDGWYHVAVDGTSAEGWAYASYVKFQALATPSPTPSASPSPTPSGATSSPAPTPVAYGICTGEGVNFREGPGTNYDVIKKIARNAELAIISTSSVWYYALCGGDYGYISASYVKVTADATPSPSPSVTPTAPATVTPAASSSASPTPTSTGGNARIVDTGIITTSGVNLRKGPDTSYASIKKLDKNTGVIVLERAGKWCHVYAGDLEGYVHEDYIKVTGTAMITDDGTGGNQTPANEYGEGKTTGSVYLRVGPGTTYLQITVLSKDTSLKLYELRDGWYRVKLADGKEGWISSKYVSVTVAIPTSGADDPDTGTGGQATGTGVTNTTVNFREEPGTSGKVITQFKAGVTVTLYALKDGWYEAEYEGKRGYLYAKYVTVTANPTQGDGSGGGVVPEGTGDTVAGGLTLASGASTAKVNFRTRATTASGSAVIDTLVAGANFYILGECGDFYYILYKGKTGYVYKAYAKVTASGTAGIAAVGDTLTLVVTSTTAEVNLREGRGTDSAKIKTLANKTSVTVYLVLDGWCLVDAGGIYGWIIDDYVKLS